MSVMTMRLWHFGYDIYHDDVMLAIYIIDILRHTSSTCLEILLDA
jgi:hypothetical protein